MLLILILICNLNYLFTHSYQPITTCHLRFIVKVLWKYYKYSVSLIEFPPIQNNQNILYLYFFYSMITPRGRATLEHLQQTRQIFVLFGEWTVTFSFYLPTFQIHFPTDPLSHSLSHLNIISSFILYHHLFFLYLFPTIIFFNKKCYIYNIFRNTFTRIITKSYMKSC